ncbi:MAG: hypothetical protein ACREJ1_01825, partial [Candidatus Methylomirabilales bacterium]
MTRISELVGALHGSELGEAGEEAVELLTSTVGTAERRSSPTGARPWPHIISASGGSFRSPAVLPSSFFLQAARVG